MNKQQDTTRKWYDLMPWWGWILTGFFSMWLGGTFGRSDSILVSMFIAGVSFFGLIAVVTGFVTAIVTFVKWRNTLPKQY